MDSYAFANNGFIWGGNPEIDFTLPGDAAGEYAERSRRGSEPEYVCRTPVVFDDDLHGPSADHSNPKFALIPTRSLTTLSPSHHDDGSVGGCGADSDGDGLLPTVMMTPPEDIHVVKLNSPGSSDRAPPHIKVPVPSPQEQQRLRATTPFMRVDTDEEQRPQVQVPICTASTPYMRRELVIWGDCVKLRWVNALLRSATLGCARC